MNSWRMAFRVGPNGDELWPICKELGIAAIEYDPVIDIDLSAYPRGEPRSAFSRLRGSQPSSLNRFVHEIEVGDLIFVKQGKKIVGRGEVASPYRFDKTNALQDGRGTAWQHQRDVRWDLYFPELTATIGKQQAVTLVKLSGEDIRRIPFGWAAELADIEGIETEVSLIRKKRSRALRDAAFELANGVCEVCEHDFSRIWGGRGLRVLQVHHRDQLASREVPSLTKVSDLAVVCANCHLLLHFDPKKAIDVEELQILLKLDEGRNP